MKLKITDVREVIGELIAETWSAHDVQRPWKIPTDEEKVRIEREIGMKLRWESILGNEKFEKFQNKWKHYRPYITGGQNGILYYAVGVTVREVHSTLDEGYAVCLVATAYDSPFGRPSEYWVGAYGPLPEMESLRNTMDTNILSSKRSDIIGSDRLEDWLKHDFFKYTVSEMLFKIILSHARHLKTEYRTYSKPSDFDYTVQFANKEDYEAVARKCQNDFKVAIHKQFPDMKVQVQLEFSHLGKAEFSIFIYNKWTNYMMGIVGLPNVSMEIVKQFTV